MKKIFAFLLAVLLIAAFAPVAVFAQGVVPPDANALTVDDFPWLPVLLIGLVTFIVTLGVKGLAGAWGIDISGKATQLTATIVLAIVQSINAILAAIPPEHIPLVTASLGLIGALLTSFGVAGFIKTLKGTPLLRK